MERIYYAGDRFLTGTAIARALVAYAAALARRGSAATIEIPVRHDDGTRGVVNLLLGPASQLATEPVGGVSRDEIADETLVADLRQLTAQLAPVHPVMIDASVDRERSNDYDWTDEV
jgi:hypothetical protein